MPVVTLTKIGTSVKFAPAEIELLRAATGLSLVVNWDKTGKKAALVHPVQNMNRVFCRELADLLKVQQENRSLKRQLARYQLREKFRNE